MGIGKGSQGEVFRINIQGLSRNSFWAQVTKGLVSIETQSEKKKIIKKDKKEARKEDDKDNRKSRNYTCIPSDFIHSEFNDLHYLFECLFRLSLQDTYSIYLRWIEKSIDKIVQRLIMNDGLSSKEQLKIIIQVLSKFGKFFNEMAQLCLLQLTEDDDTKYKHRMTHIQDIKSNLKNTKKQESLKPKKEDKSKEPTAQMIKNLKPKHPVSSFFFFYKERSQEIAKEHGQMPGCQLAKIVGNVWGTMNETEKQPFQVQAKQSRENYEKEMLEYTSKYSDEIARYKRYKKELKEEKRRKIEKLIKPRVVDVKKQEQGREQQEKEDNSLQLSDSILSLSQDMSDSLGIQRKSSSSTLRQIVQQNHPSQYRKTNNQTIATEIISNSNGNIHKESVNKYNSFDEEIILTVSNALTNIDDKPTLQSKIIKPKGPVSSFFLFYQLQGKRIASENGISLGPKAIKLASEIWKQIPASQKQKYEQQSEKTRAKYKQEMADLKQQYGDSVFDTKRAKKSQKWRKDTKKQNL